MKPFAHLPLALAACTFWASCAASREETTDAAVDSAQGGAFDGGIDEWGDGEGDLARPRPRPRPSPAPEDDYVDRGPVPPPPPVPIGDAGVSPPDASVPRPPLESCTAALPNGFCFNSESGDHIALGRSVNIASRITLTEHYREIRIEASVDGQGAWALGFGRDEHARWRVGKYSSLPGQLFAGQGRGLSISGDGRSCVQSVGSMEITEFETRPGQGIVRFAATFEQYCEGAEGGLSGAVNYRATGKPDHPVTSASTIALSGQFERVVYDRTTHTAYGFDALNRRVAAIDLADGDVHYSDVVQVPVGACVDDKRRRLFVVNTGSSVVTEHALSDLRLVREHIWDAVSSPRSDVAAQIYCGQDMVMLVQGARGGGLSTIEDLDSEMPTVNNRSGEIQGISTGILDSSGSNLYYLAWGGSQATVRRIATANWIEADRSAPGIDLTTEPYNGPMFLDETRALVLTKNRIFDATNLAKLVFTLPGFAGHSGAEENVYAIDSASGRFASRAYVYSLDTFRIESATLTADADDMFFDRDGLLWFLVSADGTLTAQRL